MTDTELPRLVGLGGLKRSGKDTLAEHWRDQYGYVVVGMSDPLLEMALVLDPYIPFEKARRNLLGTTHYGSPLSSIVQIEGYVKAKEYPEVRAFLQRLGTDVGREMIDQDLWVKQAEKTIRAHWEAGKKVALTGIRFPNELELVKRLEGSLLWIHRPSVESGDTHASETSADRQDFTWSLGNESTLERLYQVGDALLRRMGRPAFEDYFGLSQEARALIDQHGYLVAKPAVDQVVFYDGTTLTADTDQKYALLKELDRFTREQPGAVEGRVLTKPQKALVERAKREGREVIISGTDVTVGGFTEAKESEHQRILGLLEMIGWEGEVREDGKVNALHPTDWYIRTEVPEGYVSLTKDPHRPLECVKCGARHVNHIQHTKWHESNDLDSE